MIPQDRQRDLTPQVAALESLVMDLIAIVQKVAPEELQAQLAQPPHRAPMDQARPLGPGALVWRKRMVEGALEQT